MMHSIRSAPHRTASPGQGGNSSRLGLVWKLGIWIIALATLAACLPTSSPPVVKIGLIAPFEGPSRPLGYSVLYAVKLRLSQWNAAAASPRVELVALNDDSDPALAAALAAQLAVDPDIVLVLGPPQGHTARAAWPALAAAHLPTLSLVPQPDALPPSLAPFAGRESDVQQALQAVGITAPLAYSAPGDGPVVWMGDPYTLAQSLQEQPQQVVAAGSVALEDAFVAWAGDAADHLPWAMAVPTPWPPSWADAYQQLAGVAPTPMAALAYAATDEALRLLPAAPDRPRMAAALSQIAAPPVQVFQRAGAECCIPYEARHD
ncbi:MAG: ABC transporter substrate-binding protein [Chloroflexi bacterium]|nr:ABC transporter substrate-binding protein [Chloroflexota bacterium]